jgi:hypothetical protein
MPAAPSRRLEWAVRLVLYPAAIALIALWWHQHHATQRAEAADGGVRLVGRTSQGERMTARLVAGMPDRFELRIRYHCPSGSGKEDYSNLDSHVVGGSDRVGGDRIGTRIDRVAMVGLNPGWSGRFTIHSDGRYTATSWRGTLAAIESYSYKGGAALTCRSGLVRFALTPPGRR